MNQIMELMKTFFGLSAVDSVLSGIKTAAPKFAEEMVESLKKSFADRKAAEAMKKVIYLIIQGLLEDVAKTNIINRYQWRQSLLYGYLPGDEDRLTVVLYSLYMASPTQFETTLIDLGRMDDDQFDAQIEILYPDYAYQKLVRFFGQADQGIGNAVGQIAMILEHSGIHANAGAPALDTGSVTLDQILGIFRVLIDTGDRWLYWFLFGFFGWFLVTPVGAAIGNAVGSTTLVLYVSSSVLLVTVCAIVVGLARPFTFGVIANTPKVRRVVNIAIFAIAGELLLTLLFTAVPMETPWILALMLSLIAAVLLQVAESKPLQKVAIYAFNFIIAVGLIQAYGGEVVSRVSAAKSWVTSSGASPKTSAVLDGPVKYSGAPTVDITATDDGWSNWYELPTNRQFVWEGSGDVQFSGKEPVTLVPGLSLRDVTTRVRIRGGHVTFTFS